MKLIPVTHEEIAQAEIKALKNNLAGLAFACLIQDEESLLEIQEKLGDTNITAALFETYTGEYSNIFVRYGYPSFRLDDNNWYKVIEE